MKRGLIYVRVSTKEQVDKTSLETQEKACRRFAKQENVLIEDRCVFVEGGESGKDITNRPEMARMIEFISKNKNKYKVLYIHKVDRLSRNLNDYYTIKTMLRRFNVELKSVSEPFEDTPVGRFMEAILAASAQFDNDIRAMRIVDGMRASVEKGRWPHSAPVGYIKEDGRVIPDPETSETIARALTMFSHGGYSYTEISDFLFENGIRSKNGSPKTTDSIKRILTNYLYAGYTQNTLSKNMNPGLHQALVNAEIINKNKNLIDGKVVNYVITGDDIFPLRGGFLRCANCGKPITGSSPKSGNGSKNPRYSCTNKACAVKITGKKNSAKAEKVHEDFCHLLDAMKPLHSDFAKLYKRILILAWNKNISDVDKLIKDKRIEIEQKKSTQSSLITKYVKDKITESDYKGLKNSIDIQIALLKDEIENLENNRKDCEDIINGAMEFITDPAKFWNLASTTVKKDIQGIIAPQGLKYDFEEGFGTELLNELYLLKQKIPANNAEIHCLVVAAGIEPATLGL